MVDKWKRREGKSGGGRGRVKVGGKREGEGGGEE